jgi:hypothetical protein
MNHRTLPFGLAALVLLVAACGVPAGDDTFQRIEDVDVPLNLAEPSTTSTTSTTTTVLAPPQTSTTIPEVAPEVETEPVSLFFLTRDELRPVQRNIGTGFTPLELIDLLAAGPDAETSPGLDTAVTADLVLSIDVQDGIATVDLDQAVYNRIPFRKRSLVFPQIVLTMTEKTRLGIVTFTFDGEADNVPIPNNLFRRTVTFDDYASLIANAVVSPSPTTSVGPTTTVEAASDDETTDTDTGQSTTTAVPPTTG